MEYEIDTSDDETFINWEMIFEALSTSQFNTFAKDIEFPFLITDDVKTLSKNFALTYLQYIGRTVPEIPAPDFLDTLKQDDPLLGIWKIVISHLRDLGYADAFYKWGKQSFLSRVPKY